MTFVEPMASIVVVRPGRLTIGLYAVDSSMEKKRAISVLTTPSNLKALFSCCKGETQSCRGESKLNG